MTRRKTPEIFLVKLHQSANKAYPLPYLPAVAAVDPAAVDAVTEQTRFDTQTGERAARLQAATDYKQ